MPNQFPELYGVPVPDCKLFTGFKPCEPNKECKTCQDSVPIGFRILIINFNAMGDVLRNTSILKAIKRKYPISDITWLTTSRNTALLFNNAYIDRVASYHAEEVLFLQAQEFDAIFNLDKDKVACSLTNNLKAKEKLGFGLNRNGAIIPLNAEATYLFELGVNDNLKFKKNTRVMSDIMCEMLKLDYQRDGIILNLTTEEKNYVDRYRYEIGVHEGEIVIGLNTGCSEDFPNKKMSIEQHIELIQKLTTIPKVRCILFGGPEDTARNHQIAEYLGYKVIATPTKMGQRHGITLFDLADIIISGDALGMYAGIALKKYIIALFGVTCQSETDLYDNGIKIYPKELACSPCWKKDCPYDLECITQIDLDYIASIVKTEVEKRLISETVS